MSLAKQSRTKAFLAFIVVSSYLFLVLLFIVLLTLDCTIHSKYQISISKLNFKGYISRWSARTPFWVSFGFGMAVTIGAGWISYPLDTIRRRLILQPGAPNPYYNTFDAFRRIVNNYGAKSLFAGAPANTLRGLAGALSLIVYDSLTRK